MHIVEHTVPVKRNKEDDTSSSVSDDEAECSGKDKDVVNGITTY